MKQINEDYVCIIKATVKGKVGDIPDHRKYESYTDKDIQRTVDTIWNHPECLYLWPAIITIDNILNMTLALPCVVGNLQLECRVGSVDLHRWIDKMLKKEEI